MVDRSFKGVDDSGQPLDRTRKGGLCRNGFFRAHRRDDQTPLGLVALAVRLNLGTVPQVHVDGPALVQLLKSRHDTSNMKIILIGAAASGRSTDFSADDFLRDPSNLEEMRATIEAVLQRVRQLPRQ